MNQESKIRENVRIVPTLAAALPAQTGENSTTGVLLPP